MSRTPFETTHQIYKDINRYYPNRYKRKKFRSEQIPLDDYQTKAIWNAYLTPALKIGVREFKGMMFDMPFEITIGSRGGTKSANGKKKRGPKENESDDMSLGLRKDVKEKLVKCHWMKWISDVHDWLKMFGIVPYYFKPVKIYEGNGTTSTNGNTIAFAERAKFLVHFIPVVPRFKTGHVETYVEDREQKFVWIWSDLYVGPPKGGREDKQMYWIVESPPTVEGDYTSDLKSVLKDWYHVSILQRILVSVANRLSDPLHVVEFHPTLPKDSSEQVEASGMSSAYTGLYVPSDKPDSFVLANQYQLAQQKQSLRDGKEEVGLGSANANVLARIPSGTKRMFQTRVDHLNHPEKASLLEGYGLVEAKRLPRNTLKLKPFENYVSPAQPGQSNNDLTTDIQRLDKILALTADFPLEMVMNQSGTSTMARSDSLKEYVIKRLRARSEMYEEYIGTAWKRAYAHVFLRSRRKAGEITKAVQGRKPTEEQWAYIDSQLDIEVSFPRTPLITMAELVDYYRHGLISKEDFYKYAVDIIGLPEGKSIPKEMENRLKEMYDPEWKHKQQMKWRKEEKRAGLDEGSTTVEVRDTNGGVGTSQQQSEGEKASNKKEEERGKREERQVEVRSHTRTINSSSSSSNKSNKNKGNDDSNNNKKRKKSENDRNNNNKKKKKRKI